MSATNQFEIDVLALIFNNTAAPNLGDANGVQPSATEGVLYLSLHTAAPTEASTAQTDGEADYTGYARVAVPRNSTDWDFDAGVIENVQDVLFPACTGGSNTITHVGIGFAASGAGYLQLYSELVAPLNVSNGIVPRFAAGDLRISLD